MNVQNNFISFFQKLPRNPMYYIKLLYKILGLIIFIIFMLLLFLGDWFPMGQTLPR